MVTFRGLGSGLILTVLVNLLTACQQDIADIGPVQLKSVAIPAVRQVQDGVRGQDQLGIGVFDANGDERLDVFLGQANANDLVLLQDRRAGWKIQALNNSDEPSRAVITVDVDRDFRTDLVVARPSGLYVYPNRRHARLRSGHTILAGDKLVPGDGKHILTAGDINGDGWVDLFYARSVQGAAGAKSPVYLLANTGTPNLRVGQFVSVAGFPAEVCCDITSASLVDLNADRWPDLVLASESKPTTIFENEQGATFKQHTLGRHTRGYDELSAADYDGDGDVDLLIARKHENPSVRLLRNDGQWVFKDVTKDAEISASDRISQLSWSDFDNDGYLDILLSPEQWLHQFERGRFKRVRFAFAQAAELLQGRSVVADFDRNGSPDQLLVGAGGALALLLNETRDRHWVAVRLRGQGNSTTLGTRVTLHTRDGLTITRHQTLDSNAPSNKPEELVFGIGRRTKVSSLEIDWMSGKYTRIDEPFTDRRIGFVEPHDKAGRQVVLKHPFLETLKHRKSASQELMCR